MKLSAPISSWKLEFMSGKSRGIIREFCLALCVETLNSVNPDLEQSDLGIHYLPRPVRPKT